MKSTLVKSLNVKSAIRHLRFRSRGARDRARDRRVEASQVNRVIGIRPVRNRMTRAVKRAAQKRVVNSMTCTIRPAALAEHP